ncbi:hypothetical protein D3C71_1906500 [compost metagenome]
MEGEVCLVVLQHRTHHRHPVEVAGEFSQSGDTFGCRPFHHQVRHRSFQDDADVADFLRAPPIRLVDVVAAVGHVFDQALLG